MSVINKFEQILIDKGFENKPEYKSERFGPAEFRSYFEYLLDRLLAGESSLEPEPEKLWESMKRQLNFMERTAGKASEDYRKLENKVREKDQLIDDLVKEIAKNQIKQ